MPVVPLEVPLDWVWGSVYLFSCNRGCDKDPPGWVKGLIPLIHHGTVPIAPMGDENPLRDLPTHHVAMPPAPMGVEDCVRGTVPLSYAVFVPPASGGDVDPPGILSPPAHHDPIPAVLIGNKDLIWGSCYVLWAQTGVRDLSGWVWGFCVAILLHPSWQVTFQDRCGVPSPPCAPCTRR